MRSGGRPVPATNSTARPECPREARLRRHDTQPDGPWDLPGLCRSTPDLQVPISSVMRSDVEVGPDEHRCEPRHDEGLSSGAQPGARISLLLPDGDRLRSRDRSYRRRRHASGIGYRYTGRFATKGGSRHSFLPSSLASKGRQELSGGAHAREMPEQKDGA
jgi:hypothetical protein